MIPTISKNDNNLNIKFDQKFIEGVEANTYRATYKGNPAVAKFFINKSCINNKVDKIKLIKERTKNLDIVVTADAFIEENGSIVGYMMKYVKGINMYEEHLSYRPKMLIWYLKELANILKELHKLNITAADFPHNTILSENKLYFIDHDNFVIDNYNIDKANRLVLKYIEKKGKIDQNLDAFLLNLYTFCVFRHYYLPYIFETYDSNKKLFDFRDEEITDLFKKTITLDESFNGEFIIDRINSVKDIKKIKSKIF